MKKIFAFLIAAAICCGVFTGCSGLKSKKSSTISSEEATIFIGKFKELIAAANENDFSALLRCTLPDITMDAIENTNSLDIMISSMRNIPDFGFDNIDTIDIVEMEECDEDIIEDLEKIYSIYSNMFIIMDDYNIDYIDVQSGNISEEAAEMLMVPATQLTQFNDYENLDVDISVDIKDAKMVTFRYNNKEEKTVAYRLSGEGWKLDTIGNEIIGY